MKNGPICQILSNQSKTDKKRSKNLSKCKKLLRVFDDELEFWLQQQERYMSKNR